LNGARVISAASTDTKLELRKKIWSRRKAHQRRTEGNGANFFVYDPVGGEYTEAAL